MSRHVLLVGFMGAGKSTVAALIANRLDRPCVDLDVEIEKVAGRSIAQIFADEGEEAFRDRETAALAGLAAHEPSVVACGGGVVLKTRNRALLKELGTVIYLVVTAEEAVARVSDVSTRPLLAGAGGTLAATQLLAARESLYRSAADLVVDTAGLNSGEVAQRVMIEIREGGL
jgi:shikimate kinase